MICFDLSAFWGYRNFCIDFGISFIHRQSRWLYFKIFTKGIGSWVCILEGLHHTEICKYIYRQIIERNADWVRAPFCILRRSLLRIYRLCEDIEFFYRLRVIFHTSIISLAIFQDIHEKNRFVGFHLGSLKLAETCVFMEATRLAHAEPAMSFVNLAAFWRYRNFFIDFGLFLIHRQSRWLYLKIFTKQIGSLVWILEAWN